MAEPTSFRKVIQRQLLTLVSSRRALIIILIGLLITLNSAFQFGESVFEWSQSTYMATVSRFRDNIAGESFEDRLCSPVPIDIVYTWVNGSDPILEEDIRIYKTAWLIENPEAAATILSGTATATPTPRATMRSLKEIDDNSDVSSTPSPTPTASHEGDRGIPYPSESGSHMKGPEDHFSASRFQDNGELQYSLRSIEKFAPWVRNIYIVTNGQLPNWLNLNHPRLHLITHEDIFVNKSHLPTFSSPAIETHLHRIPGLSQKFIYLNDDVMFGAPVWPDDFYTHSNGQKVYLSWPVPSCADGCSSNWIGDKFCDKACNNSACDWDGGDCFNTNSSSSYYSSSSSYSSFRSSNSRYCAQGCPDTWLGDRYCDKACNVPECAFDGTDCGIEHLQKDLYEISITADYEPHAIFIPPGIDAFYVNMNKSAPALRGERLSEGLCNTNVAVRTVGYSEKYQFLSVTLHRNVSLTTSFVDLVFMSNVSFSNFQFIFVTDSSENATLSSMQHANTSRPPRTEDNEIRVKISSGTVGGGYSSSYSTSSYSTSSSTTTPKSETVGQIANNEYRARIGLVELPADAIAALQELERLLLVEKEITQKGYNRRAQEIINPYNVLANLTHSNLTTDVSGPTLANTSLSDLPSHAEPSNTPSNDTPSETPSAAPSAAPSVVLLDGVLQIGAVSNIQDPAISDGIPEHGIDGGLQVTPSEEQQAEQSSKASSSRNLLWVSSNDKKEADESEDDEPEDDHGQINKNKLAAQWLNDRWDSYKSKLERLSGVNIQQDVPELISRIQQLLNQRHQHASFSPNIRRLLDTFGDSLKFVNKKYNKRYGATARKVPSHMPHMIDVAIMKELQATYPDEFDATSSHRLRSSTDMQYSFSYFYFLMQEPKDWDFEGFWASIDTNHDMVLSDNELRTLVAKLMPLPLEPSDEEKFTRELYNCSKAYSTENGEPFNEKQPLQLSWEIFSDCEPILKRVRDLFKREFKYKHEIMSESDVAFKMIRDNVTNTRKDLDHLRRKPHKFICLNDNIDHSKPGANDVRMALLEFYESYFPQRSSFELPEGVYNQHLYYKEVLKSRHEAAVFNMVIIGASVLLILLLTSRCIVRYAGGLFGLKNGRVKSSQRGLNSERFLNT